MIVNEIDIQDILDHSKTEMEAQEKTIKVFQKKLEDNNYMAKTIAAYVRQNIEDFHARYLNDEQMKELNPLIRNAIFSFLEDYETGKIGKIWGTRLLNCPDYWEDCKYVD